MVLHSIGYMENNEDDYNNERLSTWSLTSQVNANSVESWFSMDRVGWLDDSKAGGSMVVVVVELER